MVPAIPNFTIKPGYKPQSEDTTAGVDAFGFWLLRQRTTQQRLAIGAALNQNARQFSINCFRKRFSNLSQPELGRKLAKAWLQENCPADYFPGGDEMTWIQDSITLAAQLHLIFESLDIPYYITGGVAAIAYGEPRTTQDLDAVLSIPLPDIGRLAIELEQSGFYVRGVEDVVSGRLQILQVTHQESIARADLIITGDNDFDRIQFERRQQYPLPGGVEVYLASPEDLVLNKIKWGQKSQSEKQHRDVLAVLKTQGDELDDAYLQRWAEQLGILADLQQLQTEAGV
jgi:hypothetical protein